MACGTGLRPIFLTEPWPSLRYNSTNLSTNTKRCFGCRFIKTTNLFEFSRKTHNLKCTQTPNPSSDDEFDPDVDQGPPQEAVLKAISGSPYSSNYICLYVYQYMYIYMCVYVSFMIVCFYAILDWFLNCALYVVLYVKNVHVSIIYRI